MSTWGTDPKNLLFFVIFSTWAWLIVFCFCDSTFFVRTNSFLLLGTNFSIFCIHLWLCAAKIVSVCDKAVAFSLSKLRFKIPLFLKNCRIINVCGIIQITFPKFHWYVSCFFFFGIRWLSYIWTCFLLLVGNSLGSSCSSWKYRFPCFQLFFFGKHF